MHTSCQYKRNQQDFPRVWNSLISLSLIHSFAHIAQIKLATVSYSLRLLRTNEPLWANRSGCSCQKSDSLRLLMINEQMSDLLNFFWLKFNFVVRLCMLKKEKRAHSLFFNEWCEWIAQVAHQKWALLANHSGRSPKNEQPWVNCSGHSPKMSKWANHCFFERIAHWLIFLQKNKQFAQKTDERIPNPGFFCGLPELKFVH